MNNIIFFSQLIVEGTSVMLTSCHPCGAVCWNNLKLFVYPSSEHDLCLVFGSPPGAFFYIKESLGKFHFIKFEGLRTEEYLLFRL